MTGSNSTSLSSLNRVFIPAALILAETTWAAPLLNAAVNSSDGPHPHLPFLAIATPAVLAAALVGATALLRWRWWWRSVLVAVIVALGLTATAASVSGLSPSGAEWWRVAIQPWTVDGHPAAVVAGVAWFIAVLVWGRGLWVGIGNPVFSQVVWSMGLGACAFIGIFARRSGSDAGQFRDLTGSAGWLLFLWFPLINAVIALVRQRDLEKQVLLRPNSRPSNAWLLILGAPMAAIALVALFVAVVAGPAARLTGRGAAATGHLIADGIRWLAGLIPTGAAHQTPQPVVRPGEIAPVRPIPPPTQPGTWPTVVAVIVVVITALIVLGALIYLLRGVRFGRSRRRPEDVQVEDEQKDSLFTWRHLFAQLWSALRSVFRRRRPPPAPVGAPPAGSARIELDSVRQAYQRMLRAARSSGQARSAAETTHELQVRLAPIVGAAATTALAGLTATYDRVRYGEVDLHPGEAAGQADAVARGLRESAATAAT